MISSLFTPMLLFFMLAVNGQDEYKELDSAHQAFYYEYQFLEDSTDRASAHIQPMVLLCGNQISLFTSENMLLRDSLLRQVQQQDPTTASMQLLPVLQKAKVHSFCSYWVYKQYPEKGKTTFLGQVTSTKQHQTYQVQATQAFQWQLVPGQDTTILGMTCHQAHTRFAGRTYIAWYAPDIPMSDGPYKFQGLPGLIVAIYDTHKQHQFTLTGITPNVQQTIYWREQAYQQISAEAYARALMSTHAALANELQSGSFTFSDEGKRIDALNRLRAKNNFIERY